MKRQIVIFLVFLLCVGSLSFGQDAAVAEIADDSVPA